MLARLTNSERYRRRVVALRDRAADHDARVAREIGQRRVENVAADIVEMDVDPFRTSLSERLAHVLGLVVNRGVEAEFGDEIAALLRAAGDPDDAAATDPRYLSHHHADRAGGARNDHGLARLGFANVKETEVGGHAWQAKRA